MRLSGATSPAFVDQKQAEPAVNQAFSKHERGVFGRFGGLWQIKRLADLTNNFAFTGS
ncbi:hypothetical protein PGT21_013770 [Puccinia graminis f. sp. tritici]|uniref:Uncharacterized protein n=1 Tax=Puccinia graminis f. sp. tritici TaxID=56615 RepID=A0A5B0LW57_PUCGR|nr:hypothetical protein PGT21_013770 [Puccinia graminis f. sp. tritici]